MTTYTWDSTRADDILGVLRESGLHVQLEKESTINGMLYQVYRADGGHGSRIVAFDGNVSEINGEYGGWRRSGRPSWGAPAATVAGQRR